MFFFRFTSVKHAASYSCYNFFFPLALFVAERIKSISESSDRIFIWLFFLWFVRSYCTVHATSTISHNTYTNGVLGNILNWSSYTLANIAFNEKYIENFYTFVQTNAKKCSLSLYVSLSLCVARLLLLLERRQIDWLYFKIIYFKYFSLSLRQMHCCVRMLLGTHAMTILLLYFFSCTLFLSSNAFIQ